MVGLAFGDDTAVSADLLAGHGGELAGGEVAEVNVHTALIETRAGSEHLQLGELIAAQVEVVKTLDLVSADALVGVSRPVRWSARHVERCQIVGEFVVGVPWTGWPGGALAVDVVGAGVATSRTALVGERLAAVAGTLVVLTSLHHALLVPQHDADESLQATPSYPAWILAGTQG